MNTRTIKFKIKNKLGLHARPAALFAQLASEYRSDIKIEKDDEVADGKSLIALLTLAAGYNTVINMTITGNDADEALSAIGDLINNNTEFNEE